MEITKGISIGSIEREWVTLGGTVTRDKPGHVLFKHPGLPTTGVHSAYTLEHPAPHHLVARFRKLRTGKVAGPRPVVKTTIETGEPIERPSSIQRANPAQGITLAPYDPEATRETVAQIEEQKARDRAAALARIFHSRAISPGIPTTWRDGVEWKTEGFAWATRFDGRDRKTLAPLVEQAFNEARQDGMGWNVESARGWIEALTPLLQGDVLATIRERAKASTFWSVAAVKNGAYPLRMNHTYTWYGESEVNGNPETVALALTTCDPAQYAHFRVSWEHGFAYVVGLCRKAGLVLETS
jgi:hypothetical protein